MLSAAANIYQDIAERTGGDIYLGIVGPVRTGKSTFVKRVMETLVIPNIENVYQKERARDELPQSGSGKTIMTSEPKFVPEDAVSISPDGTARMSIRMIDSVGYMIPGAMGAEEDGKPRMVTTPWADHESPMTEAAELGTRKIMEEHLEKVGIELKPGAIEILTYLKEKGIHRAISTANDIERAEKYLKKIGLYGYFDKIICAPMVEYGKPAPDVYEFACSELKLIPDECMAVEDSPNGVKSAYSAGCKVVMVPDLTSPDEELKKMLFACVDRIDEIKSII